MTTETITPTLDDLKAGVDQLRDDIRDQAETLRRTREGLVALAIELDREAHHLYSNGKFGGADDLRRLGSKAFALTEGAQ